MYNLKEFKKNGLAWPLNFKDNKYPPETLQNHYEKFQIKAEQVFGKKITLKPNLLSKFFDNFLDHPTILPKVKEIIGENIYAWSSAIFAKPPGEGKIVSYHQDNPYWQLSSDNVVTVWIALTFSSKISGALEIVPKSHNAGILKKIDVNNAREAYINGQKTTKASDLLSFNQNLDEFIKKNPPEIIDLKPGEYSIHHVNAVHGSGVNKTDNSRVGFAIRYVSSDTKHLEVSKDRAIHICGKKNNFYQEEERPKLDFDDSSINQYRISMNSTGVFGNKKY
jgi:ectoine hydroxylase-related dioxygenase (phytanoyl-CoA dioxygenase family)